MWFSKNQWFCDHVIAVYKVKSSVADPLCAFMVQIEMLSYPFSKNRILAQVWWFFQVYSRILWLLGVLTEFYFLYFGLPGKTSKLSLKKDLK